MLFLGLDTQKLFIAFKMAYSCCFGLRGNLDFVDVLKKKFKTSNTGLEVLGGDWQLRDCFL